MTDFPLKRRDFLVGIGVSGLGLVFGLDLKSTSATNTVDAPTTGAGVKMAWVRIAPDGAITIMAPATEMGQGTTTALAVIFAEELDADWNKVSVEFSPADDAIYGNPLPFFFGMMVTAASTAVMGYYKNMRLYGAQARRVLLDAAATRLNAPVAELTTEPSVVVHAKTGQQLSYGEIASFAKLPETLPTVSEKDLKDPSKFRLIGHEIPRVDVPIKTDGSATYSIDVRVPNMVYATVVRAPVLGATPISVNDAEVSKMRDVIKVIQLPPDRVAIAARTYEAALAAERALKITWNKIAQSEFDSERALDEQSAIARDLSKAGVQVQNTGDVVAAMNGAAKVYKAEYRTEYVYHAQLEPLNSVSWVKDGGRSVEVWAGSQTPTHLTRSVAQALGITPENVQLHRTYLGGGFGRRSAQDHDWAVDSALVSKELGMPVKVIWSRESDVRFGRFKPMTSQYLQAAEDSSGELIAWHHRLVADEALAMTDPTRFEKGKEFPRISTTGIKTDYDVPNILVEAVRNKLGVRMSAVRGVGSTVNQFAAESFVDEIAIARGDDPVEMRLGLLRKSPVEQEVLRAVANMAAWKRGEKEGRGVSYVMNAGTFMATIARVTVDRKTGVILVPEIWIAADVGVPIMPRNLDAQLQSAVIHSLSNLLKERITFKNGAVQQSNYYDYQVLRMSEAPEVHTHIMPSMRTPVGIGDLGGIGVGPAVANAFFSATGRRLRQSPFLPDRVLAVLKT
ncbi:MAG TPA: molybdopterin cofactor-binding domain-containing protein [Candidatus Acidoferrales bacterium]|jgi:isoquinoline 1-oxidoreductase beta subunit|nr:molybdopterin cofactor-binding domain-containing protein [Candidatus Acidoferrales bacterium]